MLVGVLLMLCAAAGFLQVPYEHLQLGTLEVQGPAPGEVLLAPEHPEHPLLHLEAVAEVR